MLRPLEERNVGWWSRFFCQARSSFPVAEQNRQTTTADSA